MEFLIQDDGHAGHLEDLERETRDGHRIGHAVRHTKGPRPLVAQRPYAVLVERGRRRQHGRAVPIRQQVFVGARVVNAPDAGQIRLAVHRARRRRAQIGFSIGSPRRSGKRQRQPLCRHGTSCRVYQRNRKHPTAPYGDSEDPHITIPSRSAPRGPRRRECYELTLKRIRSLGPDACRVQKDTIEAGEP